MTEQTPAPAAKLIADLTGADYTRPHIFRGPGRSDTTYPQQDGHIWQEFAGLAIETGGYCDLTAIDPYTGDRLWIPDAFGHTGDDTANWFAALHKLVDVLEANADEFGGETRTADTRDALAAKHAQEREALRQRQAAERDQFRPGDPIRWRGVSTDDWDYGTFIRYHEDHDTCSWVSLPDKFGPGVESTVATSDLENLREFPPDQLGR